MITFVFIVIDQPQGFPDNFFIGPHFDKIGKVICVADSGMMNIDNIIETEGEDYEYIIGEQLKNISRARQDEILDIEKNQTRKSLTKMQVILIQQDKNESYLTSKTPEDDTRRAVASTYTPVDSSPGKR